MASLLIQVRLHPDNPEERPALEALAKWREQGYSDREILRFALLALDGVPVAASKDALLRRLGAAVVRLEKLLAGGIGTTPTSTAPSEAVGAELSAISLLLGGMRAPLTDEGDE